MAETMTSWLAEASEAVTEATNAADVQGQIQNLSAARADFAAQLEEFRKFAHADALGRAKWWKGYAPNPDLLNDLKEASKTLKARPIASLARGLDTYGNAVRRELIEAWRAYAGERMGNVADLQQLAVTLAEVDDLSDLARGFQEVLGQLGRLQNHLPTAESLALLDQAQIHLNNLENALRPDSVRAFLSGVARGGASLDQLTDDVLTWLRSHGAVQNFRVVAGSPMGNSW